ncbi:MAG: DUF305 domain-containing protein [Gemmatimonadaceae bacterium]
MERRPALVSREVVGLERTPVRSGGGPAQALFSLVMRIIFRTTPALLLLVFAASAGASVTDTTVDAQHAYTAADIQFMDGMIAHHAQALLMAGWAQSHGASPSILTLTSRITNAQTDEIAGMQKWLRDRHQPVPEANPHGMTMKMDGMEHTMLMPGMLTESQLKQLDDARGKDFDRLFLTFMIQHHQGAVTMVKDLFDTYGAAQDISVFKLASDISADQTTEIERMQRMLAAVIFGV